MKWVSVKDETPKCSEQVLAIAEFKHDHTSEPLSCTVLTTYCCGTKVWEINPTTKFIFKIIYWMRIPESPIPENTE
jgi:hypothetical protein